jgi:hypothetical protein
LKDPYDPSALQWAIHDLSYFNGKYWLYWSPLPALLYLPFILFGLSVDSKVILIFVTLCLHILFIKCVKLFPNSTFQHRRNLVINWAPLFLISSSGVLIALRRPATYEVAILVGAYFSVFALFLWVKFSAFTQEENVNSSRMFFVGALMCMAIWCRPAYTATALLIILVEISFSNLKKSAIRLLWFIAGAITVISFFFAYNFSRFGNILEVGHRYQIAGIRNDSLGGPSIDWSLRALSQYIYGLPRFHESFPFISMSQNPIINYQQGYVYEPTIGLLWICPLLLISTLPRFIAVRNREIGSKSFFGYLFLIFGIANIFANSLLIGSTTFRYILDGSIIISLGLLLIINEKISILESVVVAKNRTRRTREIGKNEYSKSDIRLLRQQRALIINALWIGALVACLISLTGYYDPMNLIP